MGIGLSTWIELCGFGPSAATAPATGGIAQVESAQVRVTPTGAVIVYTGRQAHGQGHATTFRPVTATQLRQPPDNGQLCHQDTAEWNSLGQVTSSNPRLPPR